MFFACARNGVVQPMPSVSPGRYRFGLKWRACGSRRPSGPRGRSERVGSGGCCAAVRRGYDLGCNVSCCLFLNFFPNRTGGMVKMYLAVAVLSRRRPTICVFALWVFANRIEFPGGWQAAGKARLCGAVESGSPESSQECGQLLEYFLNVSGLFILGNMVAQKTLVVDIIVKKTRLQAFFDGGLQGRHRA